MAVELTERELDVMEVLWREGSGTVGEVRRKLKDPLAYTTVLTVLRTLEAKEIVRHEGEGKAYRYLPRVRREDVVHGAVRRLVRRLFRGSPEMLVTHLMNDHKVSAEELRRLKALVNARLEEDE
ncbi:MAG: BlaI/MecI/CopY family transcriptional regulator [Gemmatimonadales bacterium]